MAGEDSYSPYLIIGKLSRDFILTRDGSDISDIPGGHLLYTAIGMSPWETNPGLVSRVGKNLPAAFTDLLTKYHFNTDGIRVIADDLEHRHFISFFGPKNDLRGGNRERTSVLSQYFHAGKAFPKELLGYSYGLQGKNSLTDRTSETVLVRDIPKNYRESRCIHICPLDYLSHNLLPQAFTGSVKPTITVHADHAYMQPYFFEAVKPLVSGLTAFITRERHLRSLFAEKFRISDLDDMIRALLDYGAENIVIRTEDRAYKFIDRIDRRIRRLDPGETDEFEKIGELSCFCGGHLVGLNETYDPVKAAAYGAARASLLKNERNPYNNLHVLDALLTEKIRILESRIEG